MTVNGVEFDLGRIGEFCHKHGIAKLSLFGSILGPEFRPESDVDLLVEFKPETRISLIGVAGLEIELEKMLGRTVDLRSPMDLSKYFRDEVVQGAKLVYAA
jgi:predicted nucleotidyltransferase